MAPVGALFCTTVAYTSVTLWASTPPPEPLAAVLPLIVELVTVTLPPASVSTPPPSPAAVLALIVELVSVTLPPLMNTPPPLLAWLPLMVELVSVTLPSANTPPPPPPPLLPPVMVTFWNVSAPARPCSRTPLLVPVVQVWVSENPWPSTTIGVVLLRTETPAPPMSVHFRDDVGAEIDRGGASGGPRSAEPRLVRHRGRRRAGRERH